MNRTVIYAHYDSEDYIHSYVVYYIAKLSEISNTIIFVSDSNLSPKEIRKVEEYCSNIIVGHHGEYDFGSYKRGFMYCVQNNMLHNINELVFCNDSCFGPIGINGFKDLFETMERKSSDFWGISINNFGLEKQVQDYVYVQNKPHVQSYFFVCTSIVFNSTWFYEFMTSVKGELNKSEIIIQYEQGLTQLCKQYGCSIESYLPFDKDKRDIAKKWQQVILENGILIKKSQFKDIMLHLRKIRHYKSIFIITYSIKQIGFITTAKILLAEFKNRLFCGNTEQKNENSF